ncbi:MAG: ABC transporter transmembrane domain-containing protein, partial [Anaerolineae bacterium]
MQTLKRRRPKSGTNQLKRAVKYLAHYRYQALMPYLFLIIATLSQLAIPKLVGNIIDAISGGVMAKFLVPRLDSIPADVLPVLLAQVGKTKAELLAAQTNAESALILAGVAVVAFSVLRGLFAFLQVFTAERNSQSVAFDLRNDLFAKIQRLSFSYHDRNRTGQLMVRATDDVEKVRVFIGQGLLLLV